MKFKNKLIQSKFQKRYKRFFADVESKGKILISHCANSGSMLTLKEPGSTVWVSKIPEKSERKLRYDWHVIEDKQKNDEWVGINTSWPNKLVEEALNNKVISELTAYPTLKREVKYGLQNSRIDFLLTGENLPDCYLEIKSVTLKNGEAVQFPDAVTARGTKHLEELIHMSESGHKSVVLYVVQRQDCAHFSVADHIDPTYAATAKLAKEKGVLFLCYTCDITKDSITINTPLPLKETGPAT